MRERSLRRHHLNRMKKRAILVTRIYRWYLNGSEHEDYGSVRFGTKNANHLKNCSCNMCCNPRRSKLFKGKDKLTIQEKLAEMDEKEQRQKR